MVFNAHDLLFIIFFITKVKIISISGVLLFVGFLNQDLEIRTGESSTENLRIINLRAKNGENEIEKRKEKSEQYSLIDIHSWIVYQEKGTCSWDRESMRH